MNAVKIVLKIKSPSYEVDLTQKTEEILDAVNVFNDKYRDWSKRIIVTQVKKRAMHLIMVLEKSNIAENLSVREIRSFIHYLRTDKGWSAYTREKNKMFQTVEFYTLDRDILSAVLCKVKSDTDLYNAQQEDVDFLDEMEETVSSADTPDVDMEDDDMLTVLEYMIKTKTKGAKSLDKAEDLLKIKAILSKWL